MLFASPQAGLRLAFFDVICFHCPIGPAQTSGGCDNDWRMTDDMLPSAESETAVPQPFAVNSPAKCASVLTLPLLISTVATPLSPSTSSPKSILSLPVQARVVAEAFISGVIFLAVPPSAGMTKISPPTEGSSLIMPEMNAIDFPSGDHLGMAIWESTGGFYTGFIFPPAAGIV